jgi:hypothetical protein
MAGSLRRRVFDVLDVQPDDRGIEKGVNVFLLTLIVANVVAVILETVQPIRAAFGLTFEALEGFSVAVFTVEYGLRVWSCTADSRYAHPVWGRLRFALSFMALVDLVSILPSLIPGGTLDLRFARLLRLARFGRTLKMARYSESLRMLGRVLLARREELVVTGRRDSARLRIQSHVFRRAPSATAAVLKHPGIDVVGCRDPDNRWIRRHLPCHPGWEGPGRDYRVARNRAVRAASRNPSFWFQRRASTQGAEDLPTPRSVD